MGIVFFWHCTASLYAWCVVFIVSFVLCSFCFVVQLNILTIREACDNTQFYGQRNSFVSKLDLVCVVLAISIMLTIVCVYLWGVCYRFGCMNTHTHKHKLNLFWLYIVHFPVRIRTINWWHTPNSHQNDLYANANWLSSMFNLLLLSAVVFICLPLCWRYQFIFVWNILLCYVHVLHVNNGGVCESRRKI